MEARKPFEAEKMRGRTMPSKKASSGTDVRDGDSKFKQHVRHIPFLACLPADRLEELESVVVERKLSKDEVLLWEEETSQYFYIVYSGKVKAVKTGSEGAEHILALHGKGDFFGEVGILDGKTSPATVVAMEPASVGIVTRYHFEKYILSNRYALRELLNVFCVRMRESWLKLKVLSFNDAESRIRALLGLMAQRSGESQQGGTILLPKLTHKDIGSYALLSRETVTRQMRRLLKAGEIDILDNRQIVLNREFLEKFQFL